MGATVNALVLAKQVDALTPILNDLPYYINDKTDPEKVAKLQQWLMQGKRLAAELADASI